jgi:hypothetical protein
MSTDANLDLWNISKLTDLYESKVENNILERVYKRLFTPDHVDKEVDEFVYRSDRIFPWLFRCGITWWLPSVEKDMIIRVYNKPEPYVNYPEISDKHDLIVDIVREMCKERNKSFYKIIIKPLMEVCSIEEIFKVYHAFKFNHTEYKFNPDIPLPRDVELVSKNNHIVKIHLHVAVSTSEYLQTRILNKAFLKEKQIKLGCEDGTLEWFVEGAYKGVFDFGKNLDKIDAITLLDFLLIIKKEVLLDKVSTQLRSKCE